MAHYVTTAEKAGVFHDQALGITVYPRTVTELTATQFSSRKVQAALAGGHLVIVTNPEAISRKMSNKALKSLDKKIKSQYEKGNSLEKISEQLDLEKAKQLAEINEVDVEDTDTVIDILTAILAPEETEEETEEE